MKKIILLALAIATTSAFSQTSITDPAIIQQELLKLEGQRNEVTKEINAINDDILKQKTNINSAKQSIVEKEKMKSTAANEMASVKTNMNGLSLDELNAQIKTAEKEQKKIDGTIKKATSSVDKKKSAIKKIESEIEAANTQIAANKSLSDGKKAKISEAQGMIKSNDLEGKQKQVEKLEKQQGKAIDKSENLTGDVQKYESKLKDQEALLKTQQDKINLIDTQINDYKMKLGIK
jgi:chromosome segregation ATPase